MGWIWPLITHNQDDFWLNILAGLPFLLFDVLIIVLLLPAALRVSDEFNWRGTRQVAARHLLTRYEAFDRTFDDKPMLANGLFMLGATKTLADSMDQELQTVLPVMGPRMSQDFLMYHLSVKRLDADLTLLLHPLHVLDNTEGEPELTAHMTMAFKARAIFDRVALASLIFHQLVLKYGAPNQILRAQRQGPTHLNLLNERMLEKFIEMQKPEHRGWWTDYLISGSGVANQLLVMASRTKPVPSLDRLSLANWLLRKTKQPQLNAETMARAKALEPSVDGRVAAGVILPHDWNVRPNEPAEG